MGLEEDFQKAAQDMKNLAETPADADLLELYSLYKQATTGDCNTEKPGMFHFREKAKWEAWNGKKGLAQDAAKEQYIAKAKTLIEKHGMK